MKFLTTIDVLFSDTSFMMSCAEVSEKIKKSSEKRNRPLSDKDTFKIIQNQIERKLSDPRVLGICPCGDNILCEHRMIYIKRVIDGR